MKRYPAWQALFRSFYHPDFYRDVASNWKGLGFLYLFSLASFSSLVWALITFFFLAQLCDKHLLPIADRFPTITSNNDKFSIDKPSPYTIDDDLFGTVFTFDTSGKTQELNYPGILVTDEAVFSEQKQPGTGELKIAPTSITASTSKGSFGKTEARNMVIMLRDYGPLVVFAFVLFWLTIFNFGQALIYGALGLISNAVLKTRLSYPQLVRLAALSMTPPIILTWLVQPLSLPLPLIAGPCLVISMIYLFIGVRACKTLLWTTESPYPSTASASTSSAGGESFQQTHPAAQPEQSPPAADSPEQPPTS